MGADDDSFILLVQVQNAAGTAATSPPGYTAMQKVILWVDDHPENNSKIMARAAANNIKVVQVRSTREALEFLDKNSWQSCDFRIITDMHRIEAGIEVKDAGIQFIKELHFRKPPFPVLLYCSWTGNIARWKQEFDAVRLDATSDAVTAEKFVLFL
ncbi:hypothetical protein BDR26DRAFT_573603 [Obelidium mucronatum]|nr:hypothetical protein BDR26DRAFT_573603 [Obelidium mucronatum]